MEIKRIMRFLPGLLYIICLLFSMFSCSAPENTADITELLTDTVSKSEELKPELPDADYEGYEFRILVRADASVSGMDDFTSDLITEEFNGDIINDAVYTKKLKIQNDYNIKIIGCIEGDVTSKASSAIMAGEDAYDIIVAGFFVLYQKNERPKPETTDSFVVKSTGMLKKKLSGTDLIIAFHIMMCYNIFIKNIKFCIYSC